MSDLGFYIRPNEHAGITCSMVRGRLVVTHLDKRDSFFNAGVRVGDELLRINKIRVRNDEDCVRMIQCSTDSATLLQIPVRILVTVRKSMHDMSDRLLMYQH